MVSNMAKERIINEFKIHQCDSCCSSYKDKKFAEKCEAWCKEHDSCNKKITCYSLGHKEEKK